MATETTIIEQELEHGHHQTSGDDWSGAKEPFRASYGKLMMWYFLLSDAFTFAGFLISYGALRFSMPTWPVPDFVFSTAPLNNLGLGEEVKLPLIFVTFMSFLLIVSSVTMVRAVQEGRRENKNGVVVWMILTIIGGLGFLSCQAWEWTKLIAGEGVSITTNPFSTFEQDGRYLSGEELEKAGFKKVEHEEHGAVATYFLPNNTADLPDNRYFVKKDHNNHVQAGKTFEAGESYLITKSHDTHLYEAGAFQTTDGTIRKETFGPKAFGALFFFITGFHGFHVFSGVMFLIIIMLNAASGLYVERRNGYEMIEKIGLYWHFVDLVWVFVFLVFYLL